MLWRSERSISASGEQIPVTTSRVGEGVEAGKGRTDPVGRVVDSTVCVGAGDVLGILPAGVNWEFWADWQPDTIQLVTIMDKRIVR